MDEKICSLELEIRRVVEKTKIILMVITPKTRDKRTHYKPLQC